MTSIAPERRLSRLGVVGGFLLVAVLVLPFADLAISGHDPWAVLSALGHGLVRPDFGAIEEIGLSLGRTVAFALVGVALGVAAGGLMAPFYGYLPVRLLCIGIRSVHELFWALLLMQVSGVSVATGALAIGIPYAGIFAKVFSDYLDEADPRPARLLPAGVDALSRFLWARAPLVLPQIATYVLYRIECGIRSSAVLGFVGLPTLGFQLDSFFKAGNYGAVGAILVLTIAVIATVRVWMRWVLAPLWLIGAVLLLARVPTPPMGEGALWRFLTEDIVPAPLRNGSGWDAFWSWLERLSLEQILPGAWATVVVAQLALVLTALVAFTCFPLIVPRVTGRLGAGLGHLLLVVLRSCPEYMLAYVFLQVWGPSMLPAVLALALHNGAIIAHLLGRQGRDIVPTLRADAPKGLDLWGWELAPRLFGSFLALCLYRWEIILRESAILGMLGIATLGFYIDSAVAELRIDRAVVMLLATVLLTAAADSLSRAIRARLGAGQVRVGLEARRETCGP